MVDTQESFEIDTEMKNGIDRFCRGFYSRAFRRTRTHGQTREFEIAASNAGPNASAVSEQPPAPKNDVWV
jgi:hypothetical protein